MSAALVLAALAIHLSPPPPASPPWNTDGCGAFGGIFDTDVATITGVWNSIGSSFSVWGDWKDDTNSQTGDWNGDDYLTTLSEYPDSYKAVSWRVPSAGDYRVSLCAQLAPPDWVPNRPVPPHAVARPPTRG